MEPPVTLPAIVTPTNMEAAINTALQTNITRPKSIALAGDSITDDSHGGTQWGDHGWGSWFRRKLSPAYSLVSTDVYALSGDDTLEMLTSQLPSIISSGCGICITMIGTNDIISDNPAGDPVDNLATFYDALNANNIIAIAIPTIPTSGDKAYTTSEKAILSRANKYLYERALTQKDMFFFSTLDEFIDYTTGDAKSEYLRDFIHTTRIGAKVFGEKIVGLFNTLFNTPSDAMFELGGNLYDATENTNGSIVPNRYMIGTTGSKSSGATGDVADGYALIGAGDSSTVTCVGSKEVLANGKGRQVLTFGGTGDGVVNKFATTGAVVTHPTDWVTGDTIQASVEIEASNLSGIAWLQLRMGSGGASSSDGLSADLHGTYPASVEGKYRAELILPAAPAFTYCRVDVGTVSGETVTGTVKITNLAIEKIS